MPKNTWMHRAISFAATLVLLLSMTVSVCRSVASGQVGIREGGEVQRAAMERAQAMAANATDGRPHQTAMRLDLSKRNWATGYELRPRQFPLIPLGSPAIRSVVGLRSIAQFGSLRSPAVAGHPQSGRFRLIVADPLVSDVWIGGTGLWNVAGNWSGGVPNNGTPVNTTYDVLIDNGNSKVSAVTLNMIAGINNLTIDAGDGLTIGNATRLTINGSSIANAGVLSLNSTGNTTSLVIAAPNVTLSGGGSLTMSNNVNNFIFGAVTADTLTNKETISGAGHIGNGLMTLVNSGIINSNQSAGMTIQANGGTTNTGTLEATAGSTLALAGMTVTNTSGTISANGSKLQVTNATINGGTMTLTGASTLQLTNGTVHGGSTLNNSSTGTIEAVAGTNTLGGTVNNPAGGILKIDNAAILNLENGTYLTLGKVTLNSTGNATELKIAGANVTLSGGSVTMSNNANNYIFGAVTADTLTNKETISGAGHIGNGLMTLVNSGIINSNQSVGMTIQANGGTTNTGTLEATAGSTLALTGMTIANTGGTISANGSKLQVTNATINGGTMTLTGASTLQLTNGTVHGGSTLNNSSTGNIEAVAGTNTLGGTVNNPAGGILKIDNTAILNLENGAYPTLGNVTLNSTGNVTELKVAGANVTLSGGSVTMSNNANNYIFGAATADTLTNKETISGAGHIGNGLMTLVNSGIINSNQSAGMTIQANGGTTNTGTLESTAGSTLALTGMTVTNTGGTISANGSKLQVTNATINGGTVTLTGASTLQLTNGIVHSGSTLNNSSTGTIEALAGTSTLGGTVNNPAGGVIKIDNAAILNLENGTYPTLGKVMLNSTGNFTELVVAGANDTLSGGSVTMSNNANNYIFGAATADTLTNKETISGAGHIGNNQLTLVNSGTINSNQSAGMTIQANGGTTNTGTLEATAGSTLALTGMTVTNTGGTISANGSKLQVTNATINGGTVTLTGASTLQLTNGIVHTGSTLNNSSTGTIEALAGTSTLGGTVNNPAGGVLKIDNDAILNLENGTYPTLGSVMLNSTGNVTELKVAGANVTLSGGSVTMSNNANNYIFGAATADTLTNQETISGAGHIGNGLMTLVNSGTINSNQSAGMTIQANGGTTNTGTLEATAGSTLALTGMTVTNTGGTIAANGSKLQVTNATINGGTVTLTGASTLQLTNGIVHTGSTLNNSSTGTIEALAGTSTLGGLVNNPAGGVIKIDNAAVLNLENGSYPTLGSVTMNSTGNVTELKVAGANVTLSGGSVTMSNNANNYIFGAAIADTLTNKETISGAGHIGNGEMTLVNSGTINSNRSAGMTIQANGGTTNTGTLEATAGSTLALTGMTVTNTGGTISANGSKLQVTNATINGGTVTLTGASTLQLTNGLIHTGSTLNSSSTGTIEALAGTNTLGGTVDNPAGGILKIDNAAILNLENGNYPTLGSVTMNSTGNVTELKVAGANVTLTGGSVTMSNNANNYIFGAATADTLTNKETISGAGHIGNGLMTLVNSGTINSNQSSGMTIQANGGATNTGTLEATAGSTLALASMTVTNTGGTIAANGSKLQLTNATVNGGTVSLTGASTLQLTNGTIHGGSTLNNSATGTIEVVAGTSTLGGTVNNPAGGILKIDNAAILNLENGTYPALGSVMLNSTGNVTELKIAGANVTLSGGSVTMSNNANNYIFGVAAADTLTNQETIQGAGNIGNSSLGIINSGTILANQSTALTIQPSSTGLNNQGTLQVSSGHTMKITGPANSFLNFNSGTGTLTGGTYLDSGTLQIDNINIITNAANITLTGAASRIIDQTSTDGLRNFATNASAGSFALAGGRNFTTAGNFTNKGTLTVGTGSKFTVNGSLTNFSGTTLTGGTYAITGALQFNGAKIVTNAAKITLTGTTSQVIDQTSADGLANFATNASSGSFSLAGGRNFTTAGNFTNNGSLTVGTGSKFDVNGNLTNFSGTTLTGGIYSISGALQFNGAKIVTNAANITLTGAASQIVDQTSANGLASFANNTSTGSFSIQGGRNLTTSGNFTNSGTLKIGTGSLFKTGAGATFTQNSGTTSNSGTLEIAAGSSLIAGNVTNSGVLKQDSGTLKIQPGTSGFNNLGTLTVNGGATVDIIGNRFLNFSGSTLTGGVYALTGTLQFDNANIVTNAANITLTGTSSKILNQSSVNALANFANNASAGKFTLAGSQQITTAGGSFTNAGALTVLAGSKFTVGNGGNTAIAVNYTQTGGTTTVDGTLTSSASTIAPTLNLNGGSLFGTGTLGYAVVDAGTLSPGDTATGTGALAVSGTYKQNSTGALGISIGGTTAGKFDQVNVTSTATLGGKLNLSLVGGFVPTVGTTIDILNASSVSGTFSTITGTSISASEHWAVTYNVNDVILTAASGAAVISPGAAGVRQPGGSWNRSNFANGRFSLPGPGGVSGRGTDIHRGGLPTHRTLEVPAIHQPQAHLPNANSIQANNSIGPSTVSRFAAGLIAPQLEAARHSGGTDLRRLEWGVDLISLVGNPRHFLKNVFSRAELTNPTGLTYMTFNAYRH